MRVLDLYCCAGGAARGYRLAGFEVVGVDIVPRPRYAGDRFVRGDALAVLSGRHAGAGPLSGFDLIHASPPCQAGAGWAYRVSLQARHGDE